MTLLRYACSKNLALPQATAISLGSSHTAVILSVQSDGQNCLLATFGSGEFPLSKLILYHSLNEAYL